MTPDHTHFTPTLSGKAISLTLPEPPSANRWWRRHGHTMHLSKEAVAYKAGVAARIGVGKSALFPEELLHVNIVWHRKRKSGDLDKRIGVLLDAMQPDKKTGLGGVYANDGQIVGINALRVDWHPTLLKGSVLVTVRPHE